MTLQDMPEPKQVERRNKNRVEIITSQSFVEVQDSTNKFLDHIISYGARMYGTELTTAATGTGEDSFVQYTMCIKYEIATNVTDEMIEEAYKLY